MASMSSATVEKEHQPFLEYTDISTTDDDASESNEWPPPGGRSRSGQILSHCLVIFVTSLIWMGVLYITTLNSRSTRNLTWSSSPSTHNITSHAHLLKCGNNSVTAKAMNCKYDIMLNSWIPEPCWYQDMVDRYQADGSWAAFKDKNMTIPLSIDEMGELPFYWTSGRDHLNHCKSMLNRQFWTMFQDRREIDTMTAGPDHSDHCSAFLLQIATDENYKEEPTRVEVGFAGCWIRQKQEL